MGDRPGETRAPFQYKDVFSSSFLSERKTDGPSERREARAFQYDRPSFHIPSFLFLSERRLWAPYALKNKQCNCNEIYQNMGKNACGTYNYPRLERLGHV